MKYLKFFKKVFENTVSDNIEDIKSILYDLIDEYNIEELPDDMEFDDDSKPGIYYHLANFYDIAEKTRGGRNQLRRPHFEIIFVCVGDWKLESYLGDPNWTKKDSDEANLKWYKYFEIIENKVPILANRLEKMGYRVKYDEITDREELKDDSEFIISIYCNE